MGRTRSYTGVHEPLNAEFDDLSRRIDDLESKRIVKVTARIGTTETEVRHGLGRVPVDIGVLPKELQDVCMTRNPTETSLYLKATASVEVVIYVQ